MYPGYLDILAKWIKQIFDEMSDIRVIDIDISQKKEQANYALAIVIPYLDLDKNSEGTFVMGFSGEGNAFRVASSINDKVGLPPLEDLEKQGLEILSEFMNTIVGRVITEWDSLGFSVRFRPPTITKKQVFEASDEHTKHYLLTLKTSKKPIFFGITLKEIKPKSLSGKRVLVVDDSNLIRQLVSTVLKEEGCEVEQAQNGLEAIKTHKNFQPDLTIMDINMPEMGGFDAIVQIRLTKPNSKFMMLTSSSRKDEVLLARALNVNSYIMKPLNIPEFLERTRNAL